MELLNPLMLWGSLAISIPIVIHFWHQKKGKIIAWAATNWLIEKNLQQSRGIRLDNWFLLILRCLLLLILCFLMAKPILKAITHQKNEHKIHLVQPNALLVQNYQFELENALKKGEKCYWINAKIEPITDLKALPNAEKLEAKTLQNALNEVEKTMDEESLELYFTNQQSLANLSQIFVPSQFKIHVFADSTTDKSKAFLAFSPTNKVFVGEDNQLKSGSSTINGVEKHQGKLKVLIANKNAQEKQSIKAALKALSEVYHFDFQIEEQEKANTFYDLIFDNQPRNTHTATNTLFIFSGVSAFEKPIQNESNNKVFVENLFIASNEEMVYNATFPEFIGEKIIQHFGLQKSKNTLSHQQIKALFKLQEYPKKAINTWFTKVLLLVFIGILGLERWIALTKNT